MNFARLLLCYLGCVACLGAAEDYSFWIESCSPELAKQTACHPGDEELGRWAFEAWQRESGGAVTVRKSATEEHARIRIHWASGATSLYGETQTIQVDGQRGANIYVLPDLRGLGRDIADVGSRDPLFRDAIVYLTCLHESGHALGLRHTDKFPDIMFSFQYGGDVVEYFQRYRRLLKTRADIATHAGISESDRSTVKALK